MRLFGSSRRGSYAALYAIGATAFIGFGAIVVDLSMIRLADAEIQAVADAAAQAGVLELRRSDDRVAATDVASRVIAQNRVSGLSPATDALQFGIYELGTFSTSPVQANAVKVNVAVTLDLPFSSFWGASDETLKATATAAARPLHTVIVVDITNSWSIPEFLGARDGVLAMFDVVTAAASNADRIGLVAFHGKFGTEYTELMLVSEALATGVRDSWVKLRPASKCCSGPKYNPWMPLEFPDETGTDHAIGIQMAKKMFSEVPDPGVYRAMIIVTDGQPANVGDHEDRFEVGYDELRWPVRVHGRDGADDQ